MNITTIERLANEIEASPREQGATDEMIAAYTLAAGDADLVRAAFRASLSDASVHPSQRPATDEEADDLMRTFRDDLRADMIAVERTIRGR